MKEDMQKELPKIDKVLIEWEKSWKKYHDRLPETQLKNLEKMREQYIEHGADLAKVDQWQADQKEHITTRIRKNAEKEFNAMRDLAKDTFTNMPNAFSDIFYDAFTNKMRSAKDILRSFGDAMLRSISNAMAGSMMQDLGLQSAIDGFFGVSTFHQGGMVHPVNIKAHNGYLGKKRLDEVPILAPTGERVLNRRETQDYNAGQNQAGSPANINIQVVIIDDRVVSEETIKVIVSDQNRRFVINSVADDFMNNGMIRKAIKNG